MLRSIHSKIVTTRESKRKVKGPTLRLLFLLDHQQTKLTNKGTNKTKKKTNLITIQSKSHMNVHILTFSSFCITYNLHYMIF